MVFIAHVDKFNIWKKKRRIWYCLNSLRIPWCLVDCAIYSFITFAIICVNPSSLKEYICLFGLAKF